MFKNGTKILTLVIKNFKMDFLKSIIKKEFNYAGLKLEEGKKKKGGGGGGDILSFTLKMGRVSWTSYVYWAILVWQWLYVFITLD